MLGSRALFPSMLPTKTRLAPLAGLALHREDECLKAIAMV